MTLLQYYLQFLSELCEGSRPLPEGMTMPEGDELHCAVALQAQIQSMGVPEFVRRCAAQSGIEIPEEEYAAFDPAALMQALSQMPAQDAAEPAPQEEAPAEPVKSEVRDIYEVFLDSVCLEDELLQYLIDVLKRRSATLPLSGLPRRFGVRRSTTQPARDAAPSRSTSMWAF